VSAAASRAARPRTMAKMMKMASTAGPLWLLVVLVLHDALMQAASRRAQRRYDQDRYGDIPRARPVPRATPGEIDSRGALVG
jgi:hypothetical protein